MELSARAISRSLAILYRQAKEPMTLAAVGLLVSLLLGVFVSAGFYLLTRQLRRRIFELAAEREEQMRRLREVERVSLTPGEYRLLLLQSALESICSALGCEQAQYLVSYCRQ